MREVLPTFKYGFDDETSFSLDQDSILQGPPKVVESSFNLEAQKHFGEVQKVFFEKLESVINERGLVVHDEITIFLHKLQDLYGIKTVENCAFFHLLRFDLDKAVTCDERLDLEDGIIEHFIRNNFQEIG